MKTTQEGLIKALKTQNLNASVQAETEQVFFTFENEDQKFPSFLRMLNDGNLLQIMIFIPVAIQEKGLADLSRFLHMANKELDVPGFGLDEVSSTVFYRIVIPSLGNTIEDSLFDTYMHSSLDIATSFCNIIQALGIGAMTMKEVGSILKETPKQ